MYNICTNDGKWIIEELAGKINEIVCYINNTLEGGEKNTRGYSQKEPVVCPDCKTECVVYDLWCSRCNEYKENNIEINKRGCSNTERTKRKLSAMKLEQAGYIRAMEKIRSVCNRHRRYGMELNKERNNIDSQYRYIQGMDDILLEINKEIDITKQ